MESESNGEEELKFVRISSHMFLLLLTVDKVMSEKVTSLSLYVQKNIVSSQWCLVSSMIYSTPKIDEL